MEKKNVRIVFMGTPEISAYVFEAMIKDGYHFVGLIAQPDRAIGRKHIVEPVPTKVIAKQYGIPTFQPERIRKDYAFLEDLKPDLIITLAYGQIVPQAVLDIPAYGCLNLHGSLLPKYRGASPIQAALINNDKYTGVTIMQMIDKMDAGKIYAKEVVQIAQEDNATSLFNKIAIAAKELILRELPNYLDNKLVGEEQDENEATFCHIIKPEEEKISLDLPCLSICGWIRALSDEPGAYLYLDGEKIKIYSAKVANNNISGEIGQIVQADKNGLLMQCKDGQIAILSLQKAGKKRMDYQSFVNGQRDILNKILN